MSSQPVKRQPTINMIDFFTIFTKGGIVLWNFQISTPGVSYTSAVNALIRNVILQERTGVNSYNHDTLMLHYKLDNEFELVFVVAYQKVLQLSFMDKLLDDVHLEFRDKYKNELGSKSERYFGKFDYMECFLETLRRNEDSAKVAAKAPKIMRTFEESAKSKKTVASMIERKWEEDRNGKPPSVKADAGLSKDEKPPGDAAADDEKKATKWVKSGDLYMETSGGSGFFTAPKGQDPLKAYVASLRKEQSDRDKKLACKKRRKKRLAIAKEAKRNEAKAEPEKVGKKPRVWDLGGTNQDLVNLERTTDKPGDMKSHFTPQTEMVGQMEGAIRDLEVESSSEEYYEEEEEEEDDDEDYDDESPKGRQQQVRTQIPNKTKANSNSGGGGGMFAIFKGLVGSKNLTREDMQPALDKMRDHLIAKNVAADIALKLCDSVATKLEGKVLGTFESVASTVKTTLTESLVQILSPKRRVDILRDCLEARRQGRPYTMVFCGVNGVGKSTNLAKICFWLIENDFRVLIAACDTFRAGAVEQLRTHVKHLNALHPAERHDGWDMVHLYEKGYGKDAAGIAMEAIRYAANAQIDVVLIDTAGRMQDNEPLMRALTKLIKLNEPDLVLFVGEALVGNEAVDQLVKFNQAMADYSSNANPHIIDGIVLTKFDTIDDKVGAAISMTYITGQPIVFVGTGQTYTDLKALNAKAVVHSLMK